MMSSCRGDDHRLHCFGLTDHLTKIGLLRRGVSERRFSAREGNRLLHGIDDVQAVESRHITKTHGGDDAHVGHQFGLVTARGRHHDHAESCPGGRRNGGKDPRHGPESTVQTQLTQMHRGTERDGIEGQFRRQRGDRHGDVEAGPVLGQARG